MKSQIVWGVTLVNGEGFYGNLWCAPRSIPLEGFTLTYSFATREKARAWIKEHYGYIRTRPDLKAAPFYWKTPKPVRIKITAEIA